MRACTHDGGPNEFCAAPATCGVCGADFCGATYDECPDCYVCDVCERAFAPDAGFDVVYCSAGCADADYERITTKEVA